MPRSRRTAFPLACLAAAAAFALAYANSLDGAFHFDDDHVIERNPALRELGNLPRFFTDARTFSVLPQNATYRPLVSATLALDYRMAGGLQPRVYHLTQLALLLGVGGLLFFVTLALLQAAGSGVAPWHRWAALLAASLFCLHTGNTQTANYISARSELLSALGLLGSLLLYLRAPRLRKFQLFLVPMFLGALGKAPAVVFAPLLLCWKLLAEGGPEGKRQVGRAVWSSLPAFGAAALTFLFVEGMNPSGQSYGGGSRLQYLWTQAWIWIRYLRLFLLPTGLSADTDLQLLPSPLDFKVAAGVAMLLLSAWLVLRLARTPKWRPAALGIAWFWLALAPTSSLFPLAEVTNDHRMFLGWLGLSLTFGTLAAGHLHAAAHLRPRLLWIGAATLGLLLAAHAVGTHLRNRSWQTEESLWADVVRKSPKNGRGWMNYGLTQMRKGELQRARALFTHAATLTPSYAVLEVNLGIVHAALQEDLAAERHFRRALALSPGYAGGYHFFARWLVERGRGPEALPLVERAVAFDYGDPEPRRLLHDLQVALNQHLLPAVRQGDGFARGLEATSKGRHLEAAVEYRAALAADDRFADAWNNLGWSLLQLGFLQQAEGAFVRASALSPEDERPRNNLALARSRQAGPEAALVPGR